MWDTGMAITGHPRMWDTGMMIDGHPRMCMWDTGMMIDGHPHMDAAYIRAHAHLTRA